ncbi:transcriptional regulator [Providencia sp.]|uniref:transcriptional regulator n=1 Tax=Providencia sp. TaxID=589 RepID=UPI003340AE0A
MLIIKHGVNFHMENLKTPLDLAVTAVGGKQNILAELVGLTPQRISAIKKRGGFLPRTKIKEFVNATGLPMNVLYPDLYN